MDSELNENNKENTEEEIVENRPDDEAMTVVEWKEDAERKTESYKVNEQVLLYSQYEGLGGWLILIGLGLVVQPIRIGLLIYSSLFPIFQGDNINKFTDPNSEIYSPYWMPLIWFELIFNIAFIVFCIVLLMMFFMKKRIFPRLYMIMLGVNFLFIVADNFLANLIPYLSQINESGNVSEITRSMLTCLIWIPYFIRSKRVKATFVK